MSATHLLGAVGDRCTLCGIPKRTRTAMPYMLATVLEMYEAKARERGATVDVCPQCRAESERIPA